MRFFRERLTHGALWAMTCLHAPAAAQTIVAEVRPQRAYVGQDVRYYVQAQGAKEAACALEKVEGLIFRLEDEGVTNQSTQITIINGRRAVRETANYTFVYRVVAGRPGHYAIPPPRVTVKGRSLPGNRCTLVIEDPADDDRVVLQTRCEPPHVVLGQDATLIVEVYLKHLPQELRAPDPLQLYDQSDSFSFFDRGTPPPELALPWLRAPPQGLGPIDLEKWVKSRQVRRGFRLAGVRGGRFLEPKLVADVKRDDRRGGPARYRRYRFTLPIRGEVAGTYELPPAVLEGALVASSGRRFVWRDAFARSRPLKVEVLEPPTEGRPGTFGGAVGTFSFEMEPPTPTIVRVGDPVYVTLVAKGRGFLKGVGLDLGKQLGEAFRVERVGVTDALPSGAERPPGFPDRPGHWRQWDFKVYPITAEAKAIPAIAFSWYDPERRVYATESTTPVPITVRARASSAAEVVVAGRANDAARDVELVPTSALSANVADLNLLANQAPRPWLPLAILLALPVAYTLLSFLVHRARRLRDDPALLRRKRAGARAAARLRAAQRAAGREVIAQAHGALCGYVADLTDRDEEALTSEDLVAWLRESGADPAVLDQVHQLCEAVEAATYGGGIGAGERLPQLVAGLERAIGKPRPVRAPGVVVWLAATLAIGSAEAQDTQLFTQAQAAFEAQEFAKAAELYRSLLRNGYENGYVLYNLGNAYLRGGELGRAIAAYRRASLYLPGDANLEVNLRRALEARASPLSPPERRSILDYVLFWRPHLPFAAVVRLALLGGLAVFGLAVGRLLSGRRMPGVQWTAGFLGAATLLLVASAALDYRQLVTRDHAVVIEDGVVLRTGPGETFEARYEQQLGEGAELEVQHAREGWLKVLAGGKYEGWLPAAGVARW